MRNRPTQRQNRAALDFQSPDPQGVDLTPRKVVQHERGEQRALTRWARLQPWARFYAHIPNERADVGEARRLKGEGVKRGLPDVLVFLAVPPYSGAALELKRQGATRSALNKAQRDCLLDLEGQGWAVAVARGWVEGMEFLRDYIAGNWQSDGREWWR